MAFGIKSSLVLGLLALTSVVRGHFSLAGLDTPTKNYTWSAHEPPPSGVDIVGWYSDTYDNSVNWTNQALYNTPDFVCGKNYSPGKAHAKIAAGDTLKVRWEEFAPNHRGPIIDYLAPCNGPCNKVDKTQLKWTKIAQTGLVRPNEPATNGSGPLGIWATDLLFYTAKKVKPSPSPPDNLIGVDAYWKVKIPSCIAPGNYTLREEIIALFALSRDVTQHYPRCINLEITGKGTTKLSAGVTASKLYDPNAPGIRARVWERLQNYTIPGPPLYQCPKPSPTTSPVVVRPVETLKTARVATTAS